MIKKLEIAFGAIFIILCITICITLKMNQASDILPSDTIYDFFTEMTEGNFDTAMKTYIKDYKDNQLDVLNGNIDLYRNHWANLGVDIISETINATNDTARVDIKVNKYDIAEIIGDVKLRLLNVNEIKEDGTYITEEELNTLAKQYIKDAYANASNKYSIVTNSYTINLVYDDELEMYLIDSDKEITDILFGNTSDVEIQKEKEEQIEEENESFYEQKNINEEINNDIIG